MTLEDHDDDDDERTFTTFSVQPDIFPRQNALYRPESS